MGKTHPVPPGSEIEPDLTPYLWQPTPVGPLPSEDGVPLETDWHRLQMNLLIDSLRHHWEYRDDAFVGGNMFIYWDEALARGKYFRGPDFFAVKDGVPAKGFRDFWAVWEENGRFPDLIVELMSKSTRKNDLTTKKQTYEEKFDTPDYVAYDPKSKELFVWHRIEDRFEPVTADKHGRYRLSGLELRIGAWRGSYLTSEGDWIRFFDSAGNLVTTAAEDEKVRADLETARADAETARADAETARADAEKARADALAAEIAHLKSKRSS